MKTIIAVIVFAFAVIATSGFTEDSPVDGAKADDDNDYNSAIISMLSILLSSSGEQIQSQNIFIIGASTARYDNGMPGDIGIHSQYSTRVGWGTELYNYMHYPQNVFNQARRAATAESYQSQNPDKGPAYWGATRTMIENIDTDDGGFLLVQFGGNDNIQNVGEAVFKSNMRFYRDEAFALNLTPVFITPVESRTTGMNGTRGEFPRYVREVAAEDSRVLLLDLHAKSLSEYLNAPTKNLGYRFGNVPYILLGSGDFSRIDNTHFEERGAKKIADWLVELACEQQDQSFCRLFDENVTITTPSIYSHAEYIDNPEDPDINGWYIADGNGNLNLDRTNSFIEEVYDEDKESNVTALLQHPDTDFLVHGDRRAGTDRSWANRDQQHIQWSSNFSSADFRIYVEVTTADAAIANGVRHFTYKPLDVDQGPGQTYPEYLRFGIGSDASDGTWKTFQRDLDADLKKFEPDNEIIQVNGIRIKGVGRFDDLRMF